jgi:hypothetical protein
MKRRIQSRPAPRFLDNYGKVAWLWQPVWTTSIAVLSIVLYVNLRLRHMRLLYNTVAEMPAFRFAVRILEPATDSRLWDVVWSFGDRVISERELSVCQTPAIEKQQRSNKPLQPTSGADASG